MTQQKDQSDEHILSVPKFKQFTISAPEMNKPYIHSLTQGRPNFIYIEHDGLKKFGLNYRDDQCPVLLNADVFSLFKMFNRCIHKTSARTFQDWLADGRPYLIRWEELGSWGTVDENQNRFIIDFELLEGDCTFVHVYYVYENHFLQSTENATKFTFA